MLSFPSTSIPDSMLWSTSKVVIITFRFFSFSKPGGNFLTLVNINSRRHKVVSKYKFEGNSSKRLQKFNFSICKWESEHMFSGSFFISVQERSNERRCSRLSTESGNSLRLEQ
ncbi:hypothetical protein V8G54_024011 [Vigna mungo]|uniref:Uncharacterized protein n=1 Tax=Vigna mungo TaxID=3915 RepID=A0AAQ3N6C4_VIGMU